MAGSCYPWATKSSSSSSLSSPTGWLLRSSSSSRSGLEPSSFEGLGSASPGDRETGYSPRMASGGGPEVRVLSHSAPRPLQGPWRWPSGLLRALAAVDPPGDFLR